ncbi:outer membrane protein assembly factor BamC [Candidatus Marimicrobium litorale]|uniref:Outer membrane protein assembly factor BamC n=1 Tax=Candidatus Marimicrobium litorale TaxID=2518991 RepID=A0ABT3T0L4_9GAMM|nr:outer membrane protein assembly factor BamC [Candidatus Marimicrobium litorale]MCX2975786.1 outer membrane protein assembly factor BamC [Candidatus Marimicrobium litorale]
MSKVDKHFFRIAAAVLTLSLSACGSIFGDEGVFRDRSEDYKQAPQIAPVELPDGMKSAEMEDIYVIPPVQDAYLDDEEFEVPRPTPLGSSATQELVRIQRLGLDSWILVGVAPGQVWPQVRNFISASGMQVARADARAGTMESNWVTLEGRPLSSRFRFRMEQGVQRGTSELHVLQMNQRGGEELWPAESDDASQEAEMLRALAQYMADSAETAPVSMLAEQGIRATGKIALVEAPEGYFYLRLDLPYDRAWASLGRALEKSSFIISDRNRSEGLYYVRFSADGSDDETGWWSRLWENQDDVIDEDQILLVSMEPLSEESMSIRMNPQDAAIVLDKREQQELLVAIKGNIN